MIQFTVQGGSNGIFQGLLASTAGNEIIYDALIDAYSIDITDLSETLHLLCFNMHTIIHNYDSIKYNYKLYTDKRIDDFSFGIYDSNNLIGIHYYAKKIINPELFNPYYVFKCNS